MKTNKCLILFVSNNMFKAALPNVEIRNSLKSCVDEHSEDIVKLLRIFLPKMARGFAKQRGSVFCFGQNKDDNTGSLLKIGNVSEGDLKLLNKAPVTNLGEERTVGAVQYEIAIRGKMCLQSISKNIVLNKSFDLIEKKCKEESYKSYRKVPCIFDLQDGG